MKQVTCPDCGATFETNVPSCPKCGCPNDNCESSTENSQQEAQEQNVISDSTDDFNEIRQYSPFSSTSWFFKTPWPLSRHPERKTFDEAHPFLGWLFGPWHLTSNNNAEKEEYAVINNIFYLFNSIFKCQLYTFLWTFFKGFPFTLLYIAVILLSLNVIGYQYHEWETFVFATYLLTIFYMAFMVILYFCGIGSALHRYWPSLHRTWRRINKRYWKSIHSNK